MIREARPGDLRWVAPLWASWFEEDPVPFVDQEAALAVQLEHWKRVVNEGVPGVAMVRPEAAALLWAPLFGAETIYDMGLYTKPEWRGRGTGIEMMDTALSSAKRLGFQRVVVSPLESNPKSKAWLLKRGFHVHQVTLVKEF